MRLHFLPFRSFAGLQEHFPARRVKRFRVNEDACIATAAQFVWVFNYIPGESNIPRRGVKRKKEVHHIKDQSNIFNPFGENTRLYYSFTMDSREKKK